MQLAFDFSLWVEIPAYRMSWREGAIVRVVDVPAHTVVLDV